MAELESVIEQRLIAQLCSDESQWTYRPDIKTEEDLWNNFKYILEQNNKAKLNDVPLSESEFAKVKNDLSHASFYDAGKWQVGENGKVYVHVQRGNETLHLVVMNNEHIAGGTSVYEVINQYQAFKAYEQDDARDRRFDVTLLINGMPMIHIELKNKEHSYMDGYRQIKKYISEGKFHGIFSNVQMFVVSNAVDTKYFSAARDTELNKKFITGWLDEENYPICDYIDFAKAVLKIPQAHEMVTRYTVLDNEKKKLLILRPYQIHAIEAMRAASKQSQSGFIWHTTGSGKTMTSYKATRNLLMDIPSIEKTIFLIDRKDLDTQTKMDFQSYAENDTIDVDDTDYVDTLIKRLTDGNRQMIVTTRQKMQIMVDRRLKEGTKDYEKIKNLKVAFVVDECHRAVTPDTKRRLERFFHNSLWYGFTGTPIFDENSYEQKGDLPQTTEQLYGKCLHSYTIKEAIHDEAVLGFMVENLGPKDEKAGDAVFDTEAHMRKVLDVVLNQSYSKLGMQNGKGRTYEGLLTVNSIARAQKYYELLKKIKEGKDELKINEDVRKALPDFPKFAITYSISENEESSQVNQEKMDKALYDYDEMFGTSYRFGGIDSYNRNLNERLARKEKKYWERSQQLDLVIVVDRLLTGFDAPCLSTLFMDRQPMSPQNIIQAFSRTNRLHDENKQYGQIVTFQSPSDFKNAINYALKLYSRGGDGSPLLVDMFLKTEQEEKVRTILLAILGISTKVDFDLNADYLHTFLMRKKLLWRDYYLSYFLLGNFENEKIIFDICIRSQKLTNQEVTKDGAVLWEITLAWLCSLNDIKIRDNASKGLSNLFRYHTDIILDVIRKFETLEEDYIQERIWQAAYSALLLTGEEDILKGVVAYIDTHFVRNDAWPENVLIRDYLYKIVEYTVKNGKMPKSILKMCQPPYRSEKLEIVSEEILEKWEKEKGRLYFNCIESDFAIYTIPSEVEDYGFSQKEIGGIIMKNILDSGYDDNLENYDRMIDYQYGSLRSRDSSVERIGKKYQKIFLYRCMGRLYDNYEYKPRYSYHENNTLLIGEQGSSFRTIDLTALPYEAEKDAFRAKQIHYPFSRYRDFSDEKWFQKKDVTNHFENLFLQEYKRENYLILQGYFHDRERKSSNYREMWVQIRSYFFSKKYKQKFLNWLKGKDFEGRWMPEGTSSLYEVSIGEYPWSSYMIRYLKEMEEEQDFRGNSSAPCYIAPTANDYNNEKDSELCPSKIAGKFMFPCKDLFDVLDLKWDGKNGFWSQGNPVVYLSEGEDNALYIDKKVLMDYLKQSEQEIVWTVLGEKQKIGGMGLRDFPGRSEFSYSFYLDNGQIKRNHEVFHVRKAWRQGT